MGKDHGDGGGEGTLAGCHARLQDAGIVVVIPEDELRYLLNLPAQVLVEAGVVQLLQVLGVAREEPSHEVVRVCVRVLLDLLHTSHRVQNDVGQRRALELHDVGGELLAQLQEHVVLGGLTGCWTPPLGSSAEDAKCLRLFNLFVQLFVEFASLFV